jgi:hypothetical protein
MIKIIDLKIKLYMLLITSMEIFECPLCKKRFSRQQRLESHLKRKVPCRRSTDSQIVPREILIGSKTIRLEPDIVTCQYCQKKFSSKDNLRKHINEGHCQKKDISPEQTSEKCDEENDSIQYLTGKIHLMEKQIAELTIKPMILEKQIEELKKEPRLNQNVLQVVCVSNNDNYLDMLTEKFNDFNKALGYVKDCALSSLSGDCNLIEKIYHIGEENQPVNIMFVDKKRTKIQYFNEEKKLVIESKESFGKKIANNLQNSYLKGVNYVINRNLDSRGCPQKFLEEYDLQLWNQHIYELSDIRYHMQIVNRLKIPVK